MGLSAPGGSLMTFGPDGPTVCQRRWAAIGLSSPQTMNQDLRKGASVRRTNALGESLGANETPVHYELNGGHTRQSLPVMTAAQDENRRTYPGECTGTQSLQLALQLGGCCASSASSASSDGAAPRAVECRG
jgi:hypothetical protein